jgi:hypothetical protein
VTGFFPVFETQGWTDVGANVYPGYQPVVLPFGGELTSSYQLSNSTGGSDELLTPNLFDSASKPILLGTFTPDVLAGTDVIEADGGVLVAFQDVPGTQVWLAQTAGLGAGTTFKKRALGAGGGDGIPRLAPAGKAPWFMLATGPAGGISARLVCAP